MRKNRAKIREIAPDLKYNDIDVARLINYVMQDGKKDVARKIVYEAFEIISQKLAKDPLEVYKEALSTVRPMMYVRSRRVGGATYQVPMEMTQRQSYSMALNWFVAAVEQRALKDAAKDLAQVIIDALNKTGFAYSKKADLMKQVDANKAFAHFRW